MFSNSRRQRHAFDIWPGFVDALSALLMVIIFVLMAFVLSQFYLSYALSTREKMVEQQSSEISDLAKKLKEERLTKEELEKLLEGLQLQLQHATTAKDDALGQLQTLNDELKKLRDLLATEEAASTEHKEKKHTASGRTGQEN